jgi:HK97 gp10 family phage protein
VTVDVKVDLPDFRRQMAEVGKRMSTRVTRNAVRAAASVSRRFARDKAPVLKPGKFNKHRVPGALKRNIDIRRGRSRDRDVIGLNVGVRVGKSTKGRGVPFYWRWLEGGWIPRGRGQALRGGNRSKALQRRRLLTGGAKRRQYPFLAPAFAAGQGEALQAFNDRMNREFGPAMRDIK